MIGRSHLWLLGAHQEACLLEGDSAELVRVVLAFASAPVTREAILAHTAERAGGMDHAATVEQAVELLVRLGALVEVGEPVGEPRPAAESASVRGRIVVGVTGGIAALHAPLLVERLLAASHEVRVVMTRSARRFVTTRSFEALTHRPVVTSIWGGEPDTPAPHVDLAHWADLVVIHPLTATTLARLAVGDCSDSVAATATATRAPVLVVPSMNATMLAAPAVQHNLEQIRERGFFVAHPGAGIEVADLPAERPRRFGGAAPIAYVVRFARLLLERVAVDAPRLLSHAEWEAEYAPRAERGADPPVDSDVVRALDEHAPKPSRVLDIGTGLGAVAREASRRGHVVVATDFATAAIERASRVAPDIPVTWLVDDATASSLHGLFDLCIDRGCLGCIPASRRERYLSGLAALVRPGGVVLLKVHRAPPLQLRAHGFTREEIVALVKSHFTLLEVRESTLSFGTAGDRPAWAFVLRRSAT